MIPPLKENTRRRVLIVDDHELVRESVRRTIETIGAEVIGEATNGLMAEEQACLLKPDLIIMDIHMPQHDGISATGRIKKQLPEVPIIILSAHADREYVVKAVKNGAAGYLLKDATIDHIEETIRRTLEGEETMEAKEWRELIWRLADDHKTEAMKPEQLTLTTSVVPLTGEENLIATLQLTTRELDVLQCVAQGWTNPEIAAKLYISPHTVKGHVESILDKLGVSDRTQAAVRGITLGLAWDHEPEPIAS